MAQLAQRPRNSFFLCTALAVALAWVPAGPAQAKGTVRVQQKDGSVQIYENVTIQLLDKRLVVTSADGKGTLKIERAACSYEGELLRCLLYAISLEHDGVTKQLDFDRGTLYANHTSQPQSLPLSTKSVPPNSVVMALRTKIGTYITLRGSYDEVSK